MAGMQTKGVRELKYRAIFFDRDNTLLYGDPALRAERNTRIEGWTGVPFSIKPEEMMELFFASRPEGGVKSVEEEITAQRRYWRSLLLRCGISQRLEERAEELHRLTWLKGYRLYPETLEVLEWCCTHGLRMGVISDTSPSLPLTLEAAGIGGYFDCAICSDLVGVMKPDPLIYQAALDALGVTAAESVYVDDYNVEADGARAMGFTAFYIDRARPGDGRWRIQSLRDVVEFVRQYV